MVELTRGQKISKALMGHSVSQETRLKMSKIHKGKTLSLEHRKILSEHNKGKIDSKSQNWKGDDIGYGGIHAWVRRKLGQPTTCENCLKAGLTGRWIHWANISGEYQRDTTDWIRLCAKCHKVFDRGGI